MPIFDGDHTSGQYSYLHSINYVTISNATVAISYAMQCNATVAHKAFILGEPAELASFLSHAPSANSRSFDCSTRQDGLLRPPSTRTATGKRAFVERAASLLNSMNA